MFEFRSLYTSHSLFTPPLSHRRDSIVMYSNRFPFVHDVLLVLCSVSRLSSAGTSSPFDFLRLLFYAR